MELEVQKMLQKGAIRHASFNPRQFVSNLLYRMDANAKRV